MRYSVSQRVWLIAVIISITKGETISPLFEYEKTQLNEDSLEALSSNPASINSECKTFPGDANWPSDEVWHSFNRTLNGALLKPAPLASVCYNNTSYNNFDTAKCEAISSAWSTTIERAEDPIEVNTPLYEGLTCIPPASLNTNGCTQGGYPVYVVNVTNVGHIQAAVNFARKRNIRLVMKNTGHDFSGKSLGGGALSIWTHHLKDIEYLESYQVDGYEGPAFKVGAGVQAKDIYKVAFDKGLMVVGGVCDSIGLYGGYSQGGGHSMLASIHGMGADQILSIQLVTADGKFITASPAKNTDLFWAIRGGGGSTFGVVSSMTVKAFKDIETTVGTIEWSVKGNNISVDTFWKGVSSYFSHYESLVDQGTAAEWFLWPKGDSPSLSPADGQPRFNMVAFVAPGKTLAQTEAITAPWLAEMKAVGINVAMNWTSFQSYYTAYYSVFDPTSKGSLLPYSLGYGSRLIPRENFNKNEKLNVTIAAFRAIAEGGYSFNGYQYGPTLEAGAPVGPDGNAVVPAWRKALSHTLIFLRWQENFTAEQQLQIREDFAINTMQIMRDVTPGAGSYMNEADRLEPNFQQSFYGDNYPRLLRIKKKWDAEDVFYAPTAVGSEGWAVRSADGLPNENGRLCRVSKS